MATMAATEKTKSAISYILVHNIPRSYRASDLRNFFSQIVETGGFRCFHYRHRPEVQKVVGPNEEEASVSASREKCRQGKTCCALVMVKTDKLEELMTSYDGAFWVNCEGETLTSRCHLRKIVIADDDVSKSGGLYLPPIEERLRRPHAVVTTSDLRQMIELRPPAALPAGNVGTPTSYILQQINACNFPAPLIGKLGIEFPRMRAKGMYGSVRMDYGTYSNVDDSARGDLNGNDSSASETISASTETAGFSHEQDGKGTWRSIDQSDPMFKKPANVAWPCKASRGLGRIVRTKRPPPDLSSIPKAEELTTFIRTRTGHIISGLAQKPKDLGQQPGEKSTVGNESRAQPKKSTATNGQKNGEGANDNDEPLTVADSDSDCGSDDGEEWDRHESLHNDVTSQERTKERLFEEGQEVVWEKGGSGLVFYTDAQVWDEAEGDFDAKTSDDWDIDTSAYYKDGAGDKDARDFISMQHFKRLREGTATDDDNRVGYFEKFTRGFGRRILEGQGWSEGHGVGKSKEGPSEPIENEGQHPRDRSGFGYRGEKIDRVMVGRRSRRERAEDAFSSIYDERFAAGEDPGRHDRNARSQEPTLLKYRKVFVKTSAAATSRETSGTSRK